MKYCQLLRKEWITKHQYNKFVSALQKCSAVPCGEEPAFAQFISHSKFRVFSPLFTPSFDFHNHHLTTLGDCLVDEFLSSTLMQFSFNGDMSVNAAKQWNAVFHNHFSMRLFASELHFSELAIPLSSRYRVEGEEDDDPSNNQAAAMASCLDALEARSSGPSRRDLAGTSFMVGPLPGGQSPLGWKFSHFIGAVHTVFGRAAALTAVGTFLNEWLATSDPFKAASNFLLHLLNYFPAANVSEALLAAQGYTLKYVGKSRLLPNPSAGSTAGFTDSPSGKATPPYGAVSVSGFGTSRDGDAVEGLAVTSTEEGSGRSPTVFSDDSVMNPADVGKWVERSARQQGEPTAFHSANPTDGWLSRADKEAAQLGPFFADAVVVPAAGSFADLYGTPGATNDAVVSQVKFRKPPRDPLFYDHQSSRKAGLPFDSEGAESSEEFFVQLQRPHSRLFEVEMRVGDQETIVGKAVAWKYSVARDTAAKAFLSAVLHDLRGGTAAAAAATASPPSQ